jgi:DNA invertase Pin-like site-specific DNA recombinase
VPISEPAAVARIGYSYLRVSSAGQVGDAHTGLDRQADQFLPFCERHGLVPVLDPLIDAGVSAYRGRNRRKGALAAWLAAARAGDVPPGSVLVVEDLDRFSREAPADTLRTVLNEVFGLGLALAVVRFDAVLSEAEFNANIGAALQLQIGVSMAHEYSSKLSSRVAVAYDRKRQRARDGEVINPHKRPHWLDWDAATGTFIPNQHAAAYQRVVELGIQGYGQTRAARILNDEGFRDAQGNPWGPSTAGKVWRDRRLIGERHFELPEGGDPLLVTGYFPAIVSQEDFSRLRQQVDHRKGARGRVGRGDHRRNILQGLLYCAECGSAMNYQGTRGKDGKVRDYLFCKGRYRWTGEGERCSVTLIPYDEPWLLGSLMYHRWEKYFARPDESRQRRQLQQAVLDAERQLEKHQQEHQQAESNVETLLTSGALEPAAAAMAMKVVTSAAERVSASQAALTEAQQRLQQADARPSGDAIAASLRERVQGFMASDISDPAERVKLNSWLQTLGLRVRLWKEDDRLWMSVDPKVGGAADGIQIAGGELHERLPPGGVVISHSWD